MTSFEEKVTDGFRVAGERMNDMDSVNEKQDQLLSEISQDIGALKKRVRERSPLRGRVVGEVDPAPYQGFWVDETQAKSFGDIILAAIGRKALAEGGGVEGGVLVPDELAARIIDMMTRYGKFRANALVVRLGSSSHQIPMVTDDYTVYCPGEGAAITASDMKFGMVNMVPRKFACLGAMSSELDEDSIIGLSEIVATSMARSMAKREDEIGFLGDGTSPYFGMQGITGKLRAVDATIANIKSLQVASGDTWPEIQLVDFEGLVSRLPADYDNAAKWYCSKKFYWSVMYPLAVAAGALDAMSILTGQKARYFLGYEVEMTPAMPAVTGVSQICCLLADLKMGAYLGERRSIQLAKSTDVYFATDQIGLRATERIDIVAFGVGNTTEAGPICGLITAAS
jgi:HK97 family phage major capsid protein